MAYGIAAGLTVAIIPWTLIVMRKTNDAIAAFEELQDGGDRLDVVSVKALLDRWALMNFARVLSPLLGGIVGLVTALP